MNYLTCIFDDLFMNYVSTWVFLVVYIYTHTLYHHFRLPALDELNITVTENVLHLVELY